ncbi:hypothetical protein QUF93_00175 [Bacillus hominis]|uniref:hypothetical protein n=1 Tax=Bacillus hominis TaxID=2817478 RepID=UPI0025A14A06|nr:hypothetical protein [Bacillus hominis]MDM5191144.1 hypothetical protein [Bacillus hominis]
MAVSGECALCKKESELKLSHIIPKFVFRSLKRDSFTGRLRLTSEPNQAIQDGEKMHLLCGECEQIFSDSERKFSNDIYLPFKNDGFNNVLKYDGDWLCRFITSVNWRILYLDINWFEEDSNRIDATRLSLLKKTEKIMRDYLLKQRMNIDYIENHIFFFDTVEEAVDVKTPHATMQGSVFGYSVGKDDSYYVYTNLAGIWIVTIIKKHPKEKWYNTFVKNEPGRLKPPQQIESPLTSEIEHIEGLRDKFKEDLSEKQQKQIEDKILKDIEGFMKSGSYKRIMMDRKLK